METQQLILDVESTSTELIQLIDSFHPSSFNTVPFEGSWTPGQVAEHLLLSTSGIAKGVTGTTEPTQRDPAQFVAPLRDAFLDFSTKMKSPDFIIPSEEPKDKASLMRDLSEAWQTIADTARTKDLDATCLDFKFPTLGYVTRLELISFCVVHTKRHIWQLKKIAAGISTFTPDRSDLRDACHQ
jgi:hypothetical protein